MHPPVPISFAGVVEETGAVYDFIKFCGKTLFKGCTVENDFQRFEKGDRIAGRRRSNRGLFSIAWPCGGSL